MSRSYLKAKRLSCENIDSVSEWPCAAPRSPIPTAPLLDQVLLFPMKLGLSIALASTAILVSPALMAKRLQTADITQ